MTDQSSIEIIVVAFNNQDLVEKCLGSLNSACDGISVGVTVVDNASDTNINTIRETIAVEDRILRMERNLGYAGGNNAAIRAILLKDRLPEAILVLNPDVCLPPGSICELRNLLVQNSRSAAISPKVISANAYGNRRGIHRRSLWGLPLRNCVKSQNVTKVDRLPGCCMMIRPSVFEKIGLLDELYFLYWEELDFCLRASRAGYDLLVADSVIIEHGGDGEGERRRHRIYYMWRNQVRFAFKNYGVSLGIIFLARRLFITNIREVVRYTITGKLDLVRAGIAGLWAGLRGETGPSLNPYAVPEVSARRLDASKICPN